MSIYCLALGMEWHTAKCYICMESKYLLVILYIERSSHTPTEEKKRKKEKKKKKKKKKTHSYQKPII